MRQIDMEQQTKNRKVWKRRVVGILFAIGVYMIGAALVQYGESQGTPASMLTLLIIGALLIFFGGRELRKKN